MELNKETQLAWDFVEHTGVSIFLTGKAGTGKTTFLRHLVSNTTKRSVVVAPTGVAAINAGGQTIHSFFQLPFSPFVPETSVKSKFEFRKEKIKILQTLDLLIIDEISMVRSDLLDAIDAVLRRFRHAQLPFGGVQLLMIGDLGQLTPVVTSEEEAMLRQYYETPYFFSSKALQQTRYVTIELQKVYRQQHTDFLQILNHVRDGVPTEKDFQLLESRLDPDFKPRNDQGYIRLTTHNQRANAYNEKELDKLKSRKRIYKASIEGNFPEYAYPTNVVLELKKGAQVMFVKNDSSPEHRYYNGRIGQVTKLTSDSVCVKCPGDSEEIEVEVQEWENAKYELNAKTNEIETKVQGVFRQLPLRLAWAITIHKSQGLTFDRAIIDASLSFAPGQVYVALSRCKTLEGLVLASPIMRSAIINDQRVCRYIRQQDQEARASIQQLPQLKESYERTQLAELFDMREIIDADERLMRIIVEFFHQMPELTMQHRLTNEQLKRELLPISLKWQHIIFVTPLDQLHSAPFADRIKRGCDYFEKELHQRFDKLIKQTKGAKCNNKDAKKRFAEAFDRLCHTWRAKRQLLSAISKQGFSVSSYLKLKQHIWLQSDKH